jgi:hypothetical protein
MVFLRSPEYAGECVCSDFAGIDTLIHSRRIKRGRFKKRPCYVRRWAFRPTLRGVALRPKPSQALADAADRRRFLFANPVGGAALAFASGLGDRISIIEANEIAFVY